MAPIADDDVRAVTGDRLASGLPMSNIRLAAATVLSLADLATTWQG
jgi:hypothetical protein